MGKQWGHEDVQSPTGSGPGQPVVCRWCSFKQGLGLHHDQRSIPISSTLIFCSNWLGIQFCKTRSHHGLRMHLMILRGEPDCCWQRESYPPSLLPCSFIFLPLLEAPLPPLCRLWILKNIGWATQLTILAKNKQIKKSEAYTANELT